MFGSVSSLCQQLLGSARDAPFQKQCAGNDLPVRRSMYTDYCAWRVTSCARFFLLDARRYKPPADPYAQRMR